jgi:hypothetical protein
MNETLGRVYVIGFNKYHPEGCCLGNAATLDEAKAVAAFDDGECKFFEIIQGGRILAEGQMNDVGRIEWKNFIDKESNE